METNTSNYLPIFQCPECKNPLPLNISMEDLKSKEKIEIICPKCGFMFKFYNNNKKSDT